MFSKIDKEYKKTKIIDYNNFNKIKMMIEEIYKENLEVLTNEILFNRKCSLQYKLDSYKNVTIPTLVTVTFGVIISSVTIVYTEVRTEILGKFLSQVEEKIRAAGYDMNNVPQEIKNIVDRVTLEIWMLFGLIVLIAIIAGVIYYYLLKGNLKRNIKLNMLFETELKIIQDLLANNIDSTDISLSISNGENSLIYKLASVERKI